MEENQVQDNHMTVADPQDAEQNLVIAILSYLPLLCFLPLIAARNSRFAMFHANQGIALFLVALALNLIGFVVPIIGWLFVIPFGNLAAFILAVIGMVGAYRKEMNPLPVIGSLEILKFEGRNEEKHD